MSWYSSVPSLQMLDMWIKNNFNVLFHGRPGVGKTSMVFEAFEAQGWEKNVDYLYFSAATIDPWVDLIGVPSKVINEDGEEVLKLVRPDTIKNKTIKAFFVDELNRSHKKVRNALMELIQFKSINGLRFPNLEIIWAAVNPDEDDELKFDVEKLDLAQEDRFQIHVQIPYKPNESYFAQKFKNPEMAEAVCKWWNDQPEKVKLQLTPRRLEYAIDVFLKTNDLRFVIPNEAHISSLKSAIQCGNPEKTLLKMIEVGDETEIRRWLAVENNLASVQNLICNNRSVCSRVLHLLSDERIVSFASKNKGIIEQIKTEPQKYERIIRDMAVGSTNKHLKEVCQKLLTYFDVDTHNLKNVFLPKKNPTNITRRRKAQIRKNYEICDRKDIVHISNKIEKIAHQLITISTECGFADKQSQKEELLEKVASIVHPNMAAIETEVCVRILDFIFAQNYNLQTLNKHIPLINTIVMSFVRSKNKDNNLESMLEIAPNLVCNVLAVLCDNRDAFLKSGNNLAVEQIDNQEYLDIPDEIETNKLKNIEDLF